MKILSQNRRAIFDYEIEEKFLTGIVLLGFEVKSARNGRMNLDGSFIHFRNGEFYLVNADIPAWQPLNAPKDYDSKKSRKVLLKKEEIDYLYGKIQSGLSLIPLNCHLKNNRIKLEIGLGRIKKKVDKRDIIKKREINREIEKKLKSY